MVKPVTLPPGRSKLLYQTLGDGISDLGEHDRYGAGLAPDRIHRRRGHGKHDLGLQFDQFFRNPLYTVDHATGPANFDLNVAAIGPADRLHCLDKLLQPSLT
jgi:hypothetical protein